MRVSQLVLLCFASAIVAVLLTRPSSNMRMVLVTILLGAAAVAGVGFSVKHLASSISYEAGWALSGNR